jgi:hypothetical protein
MSTVQHTRHRNLLSLIDKAGSVQALADRLERSYSQISQLKNRSPHSRSGKAREIGDELARHIETRFGYPLGWMDTQHSLAGEDLPRGLEAQVLIHPTVLDVALLTWETLTMKREPLPQRFRVAVPDDSMAPRVRTGEVVEFSAAEQARPGDGVLVRDRSGGLYFRRYRQGVAGAWQAYPVNDAYKTLDSAGDGLELVAVLVGIPKQRWG